jgi:hypothetical protein
MVLKKSLVMCKIIFKYNLLEQFLELMINDEF